MCIRDSQNAITRGTLSNDNFDGEMDDASYHLESIEEKGLPIDLSLIHI